MSGSSIESLVCIIIFDHRTWKRTQDYWLQEQTCELGSLSADDTGTKTPLSNSLLKIEVVLSTSVRSFFCQISSIGISLVCSQYLWGSYLTQCDNNYCLRQQFTANNFSFSPIKEKEKNCKVVFNVTIQLISFNNWVTAPNKWQFVFWRFILFILSLLTTQQCVTRRKHLILSSMTFLFYQFIALTTSKCKQYFCTVFFSGKMVY